MSYFIFRFFLFLLLFTINIFIAVWFSSFFIVDIAAHSAYDYFWVIGVYMFGYYSYRLMTRRMVTTNEFMLILKANLYVIVAIFFVVAIAKLENNVSRTILLTHFILNNLNPIWSYYIKKFAFKFSFLRRPVFAICDKEGLTNIQNWFDQGNPFGYDIQDILNVDELDIISVHARLEDLIKKSTYDSAIIDFDTDNIFELNDLVDHIQKNIHKVIILPKISKVPIINGELISSVHHKGMAFYVKNNLLSPIDIMLKTFFDYGMAFLLILMFSPVLLVLYIAVYISTKGHPLFTHERIGKGNKRFMVYKFRTMCLDAEKKLENLLSHCTESREAWEQDFKLKNDPRVTKIGNFLRKTSLDELPQLINVLKGEMSLVGPRPIIEDEVTKYAEYFEYFVAVKPGITGLWQVSGRNDIDYDERVQLDVWYVRNWSIELDLQILIKTIVVVLSKKGSY